MLRKKWDLAQVELSLGSGRCHIEEPGLLHLVERVTREELEVLSNLDPWPLAALDLVDGREDQVSPVLRWLTAHGVNDGLGPEPGDQLNQGLEVSAQLILRGVGEDITPGVEADQLRMLRGPAFLQGHSPAAEAHNV